MLDVRNLRITTGRQELVGPVSFAVTKGQVLGLVGESGSGKSLILSAIMGLLPKGLKAHGSICLDGTDLLKLDVGIHRAHATSAASLVLQEPMTALNPLMSIGRQIAEAIPPASAHTTSVSSLLTDVGLPPEIVPETSYPHQLSGGQRQRVCLAIALARQPSILLADEPTTALDTLTQAEIITLLKRHICASGRSMIFVTHDLPLLGNLANTLAILRRGCIVEAGDAGALLKAPHHPYTKKLLKAAVHQVAPLPSKTRSHALVCQNIHVRYGEKIALTNLSLTVEEGSCTALIGGSGSGKSTLAKALLGLIPVAGGQAYLEGETLVSATRTPTLAQQRNVQIVFQDPYGCFNPRHRIRRVLSEPFCLLNRKASREALVSALKDVGLPTSALDKYPHQFSGGQRQRLAIARALIMRPKVLILDEPVSALDVSIRADIMDLLQRLRRERGMSYLFITHDLSLLPGFAEQVVVLRGGEVIESGETQRVLEKPRAAYTMAMLEATPRV